jgi:hypothetical protein
MTLPDHSAWQQGGRLGLPPQAARAEGPPKGADAPLPEGQSAAVSKSGASWAWACQRPGSAGR